MQAQGVKKGDVVFTWLPETGEQYETRLATFENGTLFASFHKHLPADAALTTMGRVKPTVFIHDPLLSAPILQAVREQLPGLRMLALGDEYERALAQQTPSAGTADVREDDVFALHMTSGTTGLPKSIGYSNRKYLDSVRLARNWATGGNAVRDGSMGRVIPAAWGRDARFCSDSRGVNRPWCGQTCRPHQLSTT